MPNSWLDDLDRDPMWTLSPEARNAMPRLLEIARAAEDALRILGTGECKVQTCPGCRVERSEAVAILTTALAGEKGGERD